MAGPAVTDLVALLEELTKAQASCLVGVKGRRGEIGINRVRIYISGQRCLYLNRARRPGKVLLRRSVFASQASLQIGDFVLQRFASARLPIIEMRLPNFPNDIANQSQERKELGKPK